MPLTERELGWLGGIIDGEGCLFFRPYPKYGCHISKVQITNTDIGILRETFRLYDLLGVKFSISQVKGNTLSKKPCFHVLICRKEDIEFLLKIMIPFLNSCKKQKATRIIQFLEQRKITSDGRKLNTKKREVK